MAKSYYAILGIAPGANAEEIKAAYRRLVKEFHPDYYSGERDTFQQIQEAYSVLSNRDGRREYEKSLVKVKSEPALKRSSRPEPEPLIPKTRGNDFGDISMVRSFNSFTPSFDEIFDWLWSNFSSIAQPKSGRFQNLTVEVNLTQEQTVYGGNARIMIPVRSICPTCRGYGGVGPYDCFRCAGEGAIVGEVPISVAIPPGLQVDHVVMIPLEKFGIRNIHLTVLFRISDVS
ncbi:MAG: Chaperone protein DnaJ [Syntrophus sp. SKADARSKE-3]|nr:Chaperone protein DnaJ [Syntrophus sp. SKADARSKE-3]